MSGSPRALAWPDVLARLLRGEDLDASDTAWAMDQVMSGEATSAQIAGFAVALRAKGETVAEFEGLVRAMYDHATTIDVPGRAVDIVGTGGDRAHTVNISTMSAIVVAAAGARVVKHGNRAASSACGAADLLEELGVVLDLTPSQVVRVAGKVNITFCFAPLFHPALRHAAATRRELGVPTMFNFLGPLANPARPAAQAVGVADARMAGIAAGVLARRGVSALVFRGEDGLDELTTTARSRVWQVRDGTVDETVVDPEQLGVERVDPAALRGADASYNAKVARAVLAGEPGPVRDAVLLNAASALVAYEPGTGSLVDQLKTGMARAAEAVDSGGAAETLDRWVAFAQRLAAS
ncbi:MAG: anthranilate phosphoribosyltransferase [Carbonactinosporaceae bacterium]